MSKSKGMDNDLTARWAVGTRLRHYAGSEWVVIEVIGGEHDDRRVRCVVGTERPGFIGGEKVGSETVLHGEYIPRSMRVICSDCGGHPIDDSGDYTRCADCLAKCFRPLNIA